VSGIVGCGLKDDGTPAKELATAGGGPGQHGPGQASDGELVAERSLHPLDVPIGDGADELHGDRVSALPVDTTDLDLRPERRRARETRGERACLRDPLPSVAVERVQKVADRLVQPFVRGFGQGKPASRTYLPVVHPREASVRERVQDTGRGTKQSLDLDDLLLPEDRLETTEEAWAPSLIRFVHEVDVDAYAGPSTGVRRRVGGWAPAGTALRRSMRGRLAASMAGFARRVLASAGTTAVVGPT